MSIDYKELQAMVTKLNGAAGSEIRIIGRKKDDLIDDFKEAMEVSEQSKIPEDVLEYYKANFGGATVDAGKPEGEDEGSVEEPVPVETPSEQTEAEAAECTCTPCGNTMEQLKEIAIHVKAEITDSMPLIDAEKEVLSCLDSLSEEQWDMLPNTVKQWDSDMTDKQKALKAKEKGGKPASKPKAEKPASEKKKRAPKHDGGPRPDFKFSEGTSARAIMDLFLEMFKKSKGAGIALKDLADAAEKAGIESSNIKNRVGVTIRYALLPQGGTQVVKVGGLFFPNGQEPGADKQ